MADEMISFIDDTGVQRFMGNIEAPVKYAWSEYGADDVPECPMFDKGDWKKLVDQQPGGVGPDSPYLPPTHDQDGVGECNCSATAGAMESSALKMGLDHVSLSAADLYKRINGGRDQGSTLEGGLHESMKNGIAPVSIVPYLDWKGNYPEAAAARKQFRVTLAFICPTFAHCFNAALGGFDIISGVMWYNNYKPDSAGWLPRGRGRPGGHAVHGYKATYRGGDYGIWHQNSWTDEMGLKFTNLYTGKTQGGVYVFNEGMYEGGGVGGWWAVRSVVYTAADLPVLAENTPGSLPMLLAA